MSNCFGRQRKNASNNDDREPLIPQYDEDTVLQRRLHQKLHTYQMFRALAQGFMPSNDQAIVNIRTLLASDILNPEPSEVSDTGRLLARYSKQWLQQFIDTLLNKNSQDQIQDFVWCLMYARVSLDVTDLSKRASKTKAKADTKAAYKSLQTVGTLLLTNSDFRVFLSDLQAVGREVFKDSAFAVSRAAEEAGQKLDENQPLLDSSDNLEGTEPIASSAIEPLKPERPSDKSLVHEVDAADVKPSKAQLKQEASQISKIVGKEASQVADETKQSLSEHLTGQDRSALISRLKKAVQNLRNRPDYSQSVSTLSMLIQRYAFIYSRVVEDVAHAAEEDFSTNDELDAALTNFWSLLRSFGDKDAWDSLEEQFRVLAENQRRNPEFEQFATEVGNALKDMLLNPNSLDHIEDKVMELKESVDASNSETNLRSDINKLLRLAKRAFDSVIADKDVTKMTDASYKVLAILSPTDTTGNKELLQDAIDFFVPQLINMIQHIPIPRLEVSTPDIDLLLENVIVEPGHTVNKTSFLPYRFKAEVFNEVEIRKTHTLSTVSSTSTMLTLKVNGLTLRADEIGYWFNLHSGPILRFHDEGIASFALDARGIDIELDVSISPPSSSLENILSLHAVRVKIHKLSYKLRKSRFAWLAFLVRPILRPILRRTLESKMSTAIANFFHAANRELVFARERLRATRIADPESLWTFFKAVSARLVPEDDPDVYARVGVAPPAGTTVSQSRANKFRGVYAPGSVVKVWEEEGRRAKERIDDWRRDGWRNDIFDVTVTTE